MSQDKDSSYSSKSSKFIDRFDDVVLGMFAFAERGLLLLIGVLAIKVAVIIVTNVRKQKWTIINFYTMLNWRLPRK